MVWMSRAKLQFDEAVNGSRAAARNNRSPAFIFNIVQVRGRTLVGSRLILPKFDEIIIGDNYPLSPRCKRWPNPITPIESYHESHLKQRERKFLGRRHEVATVHDMTHKSPWLQWQKFINHPPGVGCVLCQFLEEGLAVGMCTVRFLQGRHRCRRQCSWHCLHLCVSDIFWVVHWLNAVLNMPKLQHFRLILGSE